MTRLPALFAIAVGLTSCATAPTALVGDDDGLPYGNPGGEGGAGGSLPEATLPQEKLDKDRARAKYQSTTDLMRFVVAPGCAAENNECHHNEDFPDLSTEGNLWNLLNLPCNLGVGDRETVEDFCEAVGDTLSVEGGFSSVIGSVVSVTNVDGDFDHYAFTLESALPTSMNGADFTVMRGGAAMPELGQGGSLAGDAGSKTVRITDVDDVPAPDLIKQGDENKNGVFGTGAGVLIAPGDAHGSYLVRRLLAEETERVQMPLNENADNPTEVNRRISLDEAYAVMSWINCVQPEETVYSPIHYDCAANVDNEGTW